MHRFKSVAAAVMVLVIAFWGRGLSAADDTSDSGPAIAFRLTELAQRILRAESAPSNAAMRQAEALLAGATKSDPKEPRYFRLLADAQIALHDNAGAMETLAALRKLAPDDQVSQLEYIDLIVDRMETVDQKLKYLQGLVPNEVIAPEIRSAAAWRCAMLLLERRQTSDADAMVKQAITLNPLNWQALYYQYQQASAGGSSVERFNALLALMRSNPCVPDLIIEVARELASAGMVSESLKWYTYGGSASQRARQVPPLPIIIEVASEFFIGDQIQQAQPILDQIIHKEPANYPALVLRLLVEENGGTREGGDKIP